MLNGEIVAVEVIRALVGSVGIVAAVPLTTVVAAVLMVPAEAAADAAWGTALHSARPLSQPESRCQT